MTGSPSSRQKNSQCYRLVARGLTRRRWVLVGDGSDSCVRLLSEAGPGHPSTCGVS